MAEQRLSWGARLKALVPTRETLQSNRFLRPFASYLGDPRLWRMNRRSVPRGVALGLFIGVMMPLMHTVIAALLAVPARANIAVAAAVTLLINPLTIPPMYYAAYRLGLWELHQHRQLGDPEATAQVSGVIAKILFWIHEASGPVAVGVLTLAAGVGALGYVLSAIGWRWWSGSKWRERRYRRRGLMPPGE